MKRKKTKKRAGARRRRVSGETLLELAMKPVPLGSGAREVGRGKYAYVKVNPRDGSTLTLRFETRAEASRAMAAGVGADHARGDEILGAA